MMTMKSMKRSCSERPSKVSTSNIYDQIETKNVHFIATDGFNWFFFSLPELEPYYDDDREPIIDTDELDSEPEIIMVNKPNQYEYHD